METCRTCAKSDFEDESNWLDLFHPTRWEVEIDQIRAEFGNWNLKISQNDGLPQKICSDCFSKFCTIYTFRLECQRAQAKLSNIFDTIDTQSIDEDDAASHLQTRSPINNSSGILLDIVAIEAEYTEEHLCNNNAIAIINSNNSTVKGTLELPLVQMTVSTTKNTAAEYGTNAIEETLILNGEQAQMEISMTAADDELIEEIESDTVPLSIANYTTTTDEIVSDTANSNDSDREITFAFECKFCYKTRDTVSEHFLTQQALLTHITTMHNTEYPFSCPHCEQGFQDAASRTVHLKDKHVEKHYECDVCGKKYSDRCNLRHHIEKFHSELDFECDECEKRFNSRKSLNYHMKWHNPERLLKCKYCDRLFINPRHHQSHQETHTNNGLRNCEICAFCGKSFIHLKTLRWHIYRQHGGEKPYKCGSCTEVFASYREKRLHMLDKHLENLTVIEKTECMQCHNRYENDIDLKAHMLMDHEPCKKSLIIANNKRVVQNKRQKRFSGLFQCEICSQRFNMKSALERHTAVHSSVGRPYACPKCSKCFKRIQDMNWHMKTHVGDKEKPNICDVCGKAFALKYVLTQHRRSHEVLERNFTCATCGRSYLFEKSLRVHERVHTGKTYYKCDLCGESFVTHIKFKCHMRKVHDSSHTKTLAAD